jgi:hypothetical protein
VEAARWITRNAKHFSKGKLTDKRYQLMRDILGEQLPVLGLLHIQKDTSFWLKNVSAESVPQYLACMHI